MSENKETRSSNFDKEETNKLMMLLKDFSVITCKKTDHTSNKQKDAAWKLLAEKFNSDATKYRSIKQLQQKFNNMKKTARKEKAEEKYGRRLTGGGPPPPKPSDTTEWLDSIMKESISGLPAVYDSDALGDNTEISTDTQAGSSQAHVELAFLEEDITFEEIDPHNTSQRNETVLDANGTLIGRKEISKNISHNDAEPVFDTSTPKSMLRKPISKELVDSGKKKKSYTPLEARKQIIIHTTKKNELLAHKKARESVLLQYAKEEHEQNMRFKKEAHEQFLKHQEELHELKTSQETEMYRLIIEKCKYEAEKAKLELNNFGK